MIAFSISFPGRVRGTADPSASRDDKGKGGDSGKGNADACCPATTFHKTVALPFVIPRGCDFFDFSCFWYTPPECFSELPQDRHPERSASRIYRLTEGLQRVVEEPVLSVAEGTPRMIVGRCSLQLSDRKLQRKIKSHKLRPGFPATLRWTRLRVRLSRKERRMKFANATNLNRKSGGAKPTCPALPRLAVGRAVEGSAVQRTSPGNAEFDGQTRLSSRPECTRI